MEKQAIILLHGALGAKAELESLATALESRYLVYNFEFLGHGKTPLHGEFSIRSFAEQLRLFINSENLVGAKIFGYSMGGYVALYLAAEHPGIIDEIVTLGTKFHWTTESAAQEIRKLNPEKILEKVPRFASYLSSLHGADFWKTQMHLTAELMKDLGANELLESRFDKINIPCTIGLGELDDMVSLEETQQAVDAITGARFVGLPETPHPITRVATENLLKLIG